MKRRSDTEDLCPLKVEKCPVGEEIRRLEAECKRLRELAQIDGLTEFFNYRFMMNLLEKEMERTRRTGLWTSLIMIDLDRFKQINDTHGHEIGNRALQYCAEIWRKTMRRIDVPCRYGGEEFAVILPGTRLSQSVRAAERLRLSLEKAPLEIEGKRVPLTASFGVDTYRGASDLSVPEFIERVDRFLLESKRAGRNRVSYDLSRVTVKPTEITDEERAALYSSEQSDG